MKPLFRKSLCLASFAVLVGLMQQACIGECNDCGPCGIVGGPNSEDQLVSNAAGADPDGVPTVELARWVKGECASEGSSEFWVRLEGGVITVESAPSGALLNTDVATNTSDNGVSTYTYSMPAGFTIDVEKVEDTIELTFDDGTTAVSGVCSLKGEDGISCAAL